MAQWIGWSS